MAFFHIITVSGNNNSGNVTGGNDAGGIIGTVYNSAVILANINTAQTLPLESINAPCKALLIYDNTASATDPDTSRVEYTDVPQQPPVTPDPDPTPVEPERPAHTNRRYPAATTTITTETPEKGNDVTSAKTFDGGVMLYAGMALTSALGMAWMGKKRGQ